MLVCSHVIRVTHSLIIPISDSSNCKKRLRKTIISGEMILLFSLARLVYQEVHTFSVGSFPGQPLQDILITQIMEYECILRWLIIQVIQPLHVAVM